MPQHLDVAHFEVDHIRPQAHGGATVYENLAWTCFRCNNAKGSNLAGIDNETDEVERLLHPRRDEWEAHFEWDGPRIVGRTPIGRATVAALDMNAPSRVAFRQQLIDEGVFPPPKS
ncbi:MAG: HNH endonuclease [Planctomycetes bacterium]|nr:HNH endonuclease [Planctomycetota bacterium]